MCVFYFLKLSSIVILFSLFLSVKTDPKSIIPLKNVESRIIGGVEAVDGQFPWSVVTFFTNSVPSSWFCGGSVLNEKYILTAAHCISDANVGWVTLGVVDYFNSFDRTHLFSNTFTKHEDFDPVTLANDIGVLRLELTLSFNNPNYISTIDLVTDQPAANTEIVVNGWGLLADVDRIDQNSVLHYSSLTTIENSECSAIYGEGVIVDGMMCAVSTSGNFTNTCFGDSGGPAFVYDGDNAILVGVITFISARGCEYGDPAGFASVAYYRDWILQNSVV